MDANSKDAKNNKLSRRDFLKDMTIGSVVVAGSGLLTGCNSNSQDTGLPKEWDYETDVVVIGSGAAGMSAAVEVVEAGKSVLVLEQYEVLGGATGGCQIYSAWSSKLNLPQLVQGVEDNAELMFADSMKASGNMADPEQVRLMCEQSPDAINFLLDHGCEFEDTLRFAEGRNGQGKYALKIAGMLSPTLLPHVEKGGKLLLGTKFTEIIKQDPPGNRVIGIKAVDKDGKELNIKAGQGIILATGMWTDDEKMLLRHWPTLSQEIIEIDRTFAGLGLPFGPFTGEAIRAAQRLGASTRHMDYFGGEGYYATPEYLQKGVAIGGLTRMPNEVHINLNGQRFYDEGKTRGSMAEDVFKQPEATYFVVEDGNLIPGSLMPWAPMEKIEEWVAAGYMVRGNTIDELAAELESKFNIPATAVVETLTNYNSYCDTGVDMEFGKAKVFLTKLDTPPFYVSPPQTAKAEYTYGGVDANMNAQVLDLDGEVIPGLYAAGMCAGGHFGKDSILGNYQINAVVFGRIAGKNAAAEAPWS